MSAPARRAMPLRGARNAFRAVRAGLLDGLKSRFAEICSLNRLSGLHALRYADHP